MIEVHIASASDTVINSLTSMMNSELIIEVLFNAHHDDQSFQPLF